MPQQPQPIAPEDQTLIRPYPMMGLLLLAVAWLGLVVRLLVTDVWDETGLARTATDPTNTLGGLLLAPWLPGGTLFRPLGLDLAYLTAWLAGNFDLAWRALRLLNTLLLLGATTLLVDALRRFGAGVFAQLGFAALLLFSGAGIITAGWGANVFDALCLMLLAAGIWSLARGENTSAGLLLGLACFAKETALLGLALPPLLVWLGVLERRRLWPILLPGLALCCVYLLARQQMVPLGSAGDVHGLDPGNWLPTLVDFAGAFWSAGIPAGLLVFLLPFLLTFRLRLGVAGLLLVALASALYMGMVVAPEDPPLIHFATFSGRLYLIPLALVLWLFALRNRRLALLYAAVPLLWGGLQTWDRSLAMQQAYGSIYRQAAASPEDLVIHAAVHGHGQPDRGPVQILNDGKRRLFIGHHADAPLLLDEYSGVLLPNSPCPWVIAPANAGEPSPLHLDTLTSHGSRVELTGWATAPCTASERPLPLPAGLPEGTRLSSEERPDVVAALRTRAMARAGFRLRADFADPAAASAWVRSLCATVTTTQAPACAPPPRPARRIQ